MHMGIPVCKRARIAEKFAYGDPITHNEIVRIWGLTTGDDDNDDNDDGDGTERRINQIEATAVAGGNNSHRRSMAESDDDEDDEVGADGSTMYDDAMMVAANDDCGRGGRCPSHRRWRLEVVLPSPTLSRDDGG